MYWTQLAYPALLLLLLFFSTYQMVGTSSVKGDEVAADSAVPVPDYELLDEIFGDPRRHKRRHKRQATGSGTTTDEGSGGTTDFMANTTVEPTTVATTLPPVTTPPVVTIQNCSLPDSRSPLTFSSEEDARYMALCHSVCLNNRLDLNVNRSVLLGAPTWPQLFHSFFISPMDGLMGRDCLLRGNPNRCSISAACPDSVNEVHACRLGCIAFLRGGSDRCSGRCRDQCQGYCIGEFIGGIGCDSNQLPLPSCRITCRKPSCVDGCEETQIFRRNVLPEGRPYPPEANPVAPPMLTHILGTRYMVNISPGIPMATVVAGFTTVFLRAATPDRTRYYALTNSAEVDLDEFACRSDVNVSFGVANSDGLSEYSPPTLVNVSNIREFTEDFPNQLNASQITFSMAPDERLDFFFYYTINVSWTVPDNHEFAEGYFVRVSSTPLCGSTQFRINDTRQTSHFFQVTEAERISDASDSLPLARCKYNVEIEVLPRYVERGDVAASVNITTTVGKFQSSSLVATCSRTQMFRRYFPHVSLSFSVSSPWLTPQALVALGGDVYIARIELGKSGKPVVEGQGLNYVRYNLNFSTGNEAVVLNLSSSLNAVDAGHAYQLIIEMMWGNSIPQQNGMSRVDADGIRVFCMINDVGPIKYPPIPPQDISIRSRDLVAIAKDQFRADVSFDFVFSPVPNGGDQAVTYFEVWFDEGVVPEGEMLTEGAPRIGASDRSRNVSREVRFSGLMTTLYLQMRILTVNTVSDWGSPLHVTFTTDDTLPGPLPENSFNISQFSYSTEPGSNGNVAVTINVSVEHNIPMDDTSQRLEIWVGPRQLQRAQNVLDSSLASLVTIDQLSSPIVRTFELPALGTPVYFQMRLINVADLGGNWTEPLSINVPEVPPPVVIPPTMPEVSLVFDKSGVTLMVTVAVEWSSAEDQVPPTLTSGNDSIANDNSTTGRRKKRAVVTEPVPTVTGFILVLGLDPLDDPYEDPSAAYVIELVSLMSGVSANRREVNGAFALGDLYESANNVTIYLQMRSVSGQVSGRWSEPIAIPVDLATATRVTLSFPVSTEEAGGSNAQSVLVGVLVPLGVVILVVIAIIVALIIYFCYSQYKLKDSLKGGDDKAMKLWMDDVGTPYIAPGMVKGKELVVDEWEIPTTDVIVEDHLGEGAFGLVFKGTIRGPLRNPKLSAKLKHTIGLPVAVKLLKDTATRKERSDFLMEIDMMKKISEGYCSNIVNMVGCVTLQEPLCLITEFVSHGDLLEYLRNQRKKKSSRQREEKYLRLQLEQQRKAYEDMKRKMEYLQYQQEAGPDVARTTTGGSGYADFPEASPSSPQEGSDQLKLLAENPSSAETEVNVVVVDRTGHANGEVDGFTNACFNTSGDVPSPASNGDLAGNGNFGGQEGGATEGGSGFGAAASAGAMGNSAAPYLEATTEYSHLDPLKPQEPHPQEEELEEDLYADIGDIDGNDLMQFAYQIATGMEYLSSINIVHRDLACRNILVGEGKNLKITDFGLSREVEDVYVKTTKGRLPLKWMALESIEAREFTTLSDVWSYGVTMWEIGTMGGFPYPTVQNQDLLMMLKQGYRLEKPENCAPEVYEVMLECWQEHPIDRPTFSELRKKFGDLLMASTSDSYMMLEVDESKTYYVMGEVEEKKFKGSQTSLASTDSDSSIKKTKKKKIEKPKWAQDANAYVDTPSTFKEGHTHSVDEHYRHNTTGAATFAGEKSVPKSNDGAKNDGGDDAGEGSSQQGMPSHAPLSLSASLPPSKGHVGGFGLDDVGIPLSFVTSDKQNGQLQGGSGGGDRDLKKTKSNPYVEDPRTRQPLVEAQPANGVSGDVRTVGNGQEMKLAPLTAELNSLLIGRRENEEDKVTSM